MTRVEILRSYLEKYYAEHPVKPFFHGWHHIVFVTEKATNLANELNVQNVDIITTSALVHDLNYLVRPYSRAHEGQALRQKILAQHNYTQEEIECIEWIITTEDLRARDDKINLEAQILSDADTLYKCLPTSAPLFTKGYIDQSDISIKQMAESIIKYQLPLIQKGIYFYSEPYKKRYQVWAEHNIKTWQLVLESLQDQDICNVLTMAGMKA